MNSCSFYRGCIILTGQVKLPINFCIWLIVSYMYVCVCLLSVLSQTWIYKSSLIKAATSKSPKHLKETKQDNKQWTQTSEGNKQDNKQETQTYEGNKQDKHTMCALFVPFIPSLNDQNQLSILKCIYRWKWTVKCNGFTTDQAIFGLSLCPH